MSARPVRRADAARARQRRGARRPVDPSAARPSREPRPDSRTLVDRRHRRQGPVRQLQHQRHQGGRRVHRRQRRSRARSAWSAARAATSSAAAASTCCSSRSASSRSCASTTRRRSRRRRSRRSRRATVDRVMLVYNEFKSVMTQRVVVDQLLPIARRRRRRRTRALTPATEPGRLPVRAGAAGDLRPAAAALRRGAGLPRAARVERGVLRGADDGDGHGDARTRRT